MYSVWSAFKIDHPLYYWVGNTAITVFDYGPSRQPYLLLLCDNEYADPSVRSSFNETVYSRVSEMHLATAGKTSVYAVALTIHDIICESIEYKYVNGVPDTAPQSHTIYGFFSGAGGVCETYSKTLQLLLNFIGIENVYVFNEVHAWNIVKADDGNWYWIDATFDDPSNLDNVLHIFFFKNDTEDIYAGSGYVGSGNFIDNHHSLLDPANTEYNSSLGLYFVYPLPARSPAPYSGPTD